MIDLSLDATQIAAIYNGGNKEAREALKTALGDQFSTVLPVTERVKTFEDALNELGEDHQFCKEYRSAKYICSSVSPDLLAYAKLRVIVAALNEGWEPQFTEDEKRYYPYYTLYTKEEVEEMTEERKEELGLLLWGGSAIYGSLCGLACAHSNPAWPVSAAYFGSRLAFKSSELAVYAGKQFMDIFVNFCLIPPQKEEKE